MSENTVFNEDLPAGKLTCWATITQVCNALGVSRNTVIKVVKRAWDNDELWVTKENAPNGNTYYLIDTEHPTFLSHEKRWRQHQASRQTPHRSYAEQWKQDETGRDVLDIDEFNLDDLLIPTWRQGEKHFLPYLPSPLSGQENQESGLRRWPHLRRWLHSQGVQVFTNVVIEEGEEKLWHWRWGDLHGEGYPSDEEAIVAALQSQLDANEAVIAALQSQLDANTEKSGEQDIIPASHPAQQEPPKPQRRSFFSRGDGSRSFA